jgi:hypothetical protein
MVNFPTLVGPDGQLVVLAGVFRGRRQGRAVPSQLDRQSIDFWHRPNGMLRGTA